MLFLNLYDAIPIFCIRHSLKKISSLTKYLELKNAIFFRHAFSFTVMGRFVLAIITNFYDRINVFDGSLEKKIYKRERKLICLLLDFIRNKLLCDSAFCGVPPPPLFLQLNRSGRFSDF